VIFGSRIENGAALIRVGDQRDKEPFTLFGTNIPAEKNQELN
jgi:hypothetical protein